MTDGEGRRKLNVAPMLDWLDEQLAEHGSVDAASRALGVSARKIDGWAKRTDPLISLDLADRALCNADWPQRLYEFWPELLPEGVAA